MTCLGKSRNHTGACVFCNGHEDAVENVNWGAGCVNLCARHAKQVNCSAGWQRRMVASADLKGEQTRSGIPS